MAFAVWCALSGLRLQEVKKESKKMSAEVRKKAEDLESKVLSMLGTDKIDLGKFVTTFWALFLSRMLFFALLLRGSALAL